MSKTINSVKNINSLALYRKFSYPEFWSLGQNLEEYHNDVRVETDLS